jgi:hypothetical protein
MANISNNESYTSAAPAVPKPVTISLPTATPTVYRPSTTYQNLGNLRSIELNPGAPTPPPVPGTPQYTQATNAAISQYGQLKNLGTQAQFGEPTDPGNYSADIPVPSDYVGFLPAGGYTGQDGTSGTWASPVTPVIKNYPGDVPGQYVEDTSNPNALIKTGSVGADGSTVRGSSPVEDNAIRNNQSGFLYQIDHIVPLELGGADTMANRELLTYSQNQQKTTAQAVPYTLYAHGLIDLDQARLMASSWQNRDIGGLSVPDGVGMIPLKQAQDAAAKWSQPVAPKISDVIAGIPQAAKDLGKGFLPDPLREFIKGFASGATMGFVPYESGENEDVFSKIAGYGGQLAGGIGSFVVGGAILDGVLGVGAAGLRVLGALRGTAATAAEGAGLVSAEAGATEAAPGLGTRLLNALKTPAAAPIIKAVPDTAPSYIYKGFVSPLTKPTVQGALKFAGTNVLVGQMQQLVQNHLAPDILSGKRQATDEQNLIPRIISDAVIGSIAGVASPTLRGASLAMAPVLAMNFIEDPYHPMNALTSAAVFGAFHLAGAGAKKADIADLKQSFTDTAATPEFQTFKTQVLDKPHYNTLSYYAPELYPELKDGESIPASAYDPAQVTTAANKAIAALDIRREFDINPDGTQADVGMSDQAYNAEKTRIVTASGQMAIGGLSPELQEQANVANVISFAKSLKSKGKGPNGESLGSRFDQLQDIWVPKVTNDVGQYIADNKEALSATPQTAAPNTNSTFLEGDMAGTGVGIRKNTDIARQYFSQEAGWDTLPRVSLHWRPELESVFAMGNKVKADNPTLAAGRAPDPNPGNATQIFGYKQNQQTGQIKTYALGYIAGDGRLNTDPFAINKETAKWQNPPPPIAIHKDMLVPAMDQNGLHVALATIDWRSTDATVKSGNPFGVYNMTAKEWNDSMTMRDKLAADGVQNPYSQNIATIRNSQNAKNVSTAISNASDQLKTDITDPASPQELQSNLEKNVDLIVTPAESAEIFQMKDEPAVKQGLETMVDTENSGDGKQAFKAKVLFMKIVKDTKLNKVTMEDYPPTTAPDVPQNAVNDSKLTPEDPKVTVNTPEVTQNTPKLTLVKQEPGSMNITPRMQELMDAAGNRNLTDAERQEFDRLAGSRTIGQARVPDDLNVLRDRATPIIEDAKFEMNSSGPNMHKVALNKALNRVQSDDTLNPSQKLRVKEYVKEELGNEESMLADTASSAADVAEPFHESTNPEDEANKAFAPAKEPPPAVKTSPDMTFANIMSGLKADKNTPTFSLYHALDSGLKELFGKDYQKNADARRALSTWDDLFSRQINSAGREITQPKKTFDLFASGITNKDSAYGQSLEERKAQLAANPVGEGTTDSGTDAYANLGAGTSVHKDVQDDSAYGHLTFGESRLTPGAVLDGPYTGAQAVRDVQSIFLDKQGGILTTLGKRIPPAQYQKLKALFGSLEAEASKADKGVDNAKASLPELRKRYTSLTKALETAPDPTLQQAADDTKAEIAQHEKFVGATHDGAGGPGFFQNLGNSFLDSISSHITVPDPNSGVAGVAAPAPTPSTYNVRGMNVSDGDLKEASNILYGEISNRDPDRQSFEVNNIINTAINRSQSPGPDYGKTLTQVLQRPAQYQGYAPNGMTLHGGKVVQSQYQMAESGAASTSPKMKTITDTLSKLKSGQFPDTTGGSTFYVHASDGTMWLGKTTKEAKDNANAHEKQLGAKKTQWGTAVGLPASLAVNSK